MTNSSPMIDSIGRRINYIRLSVTDRCDLRCRYYMAEKMEFVPRSEILSFGEIELLTDIFIARGVNRIRLTGGEPLVRRDILKLVAALGSRVGQGLDELTMTTNGTQLAGAAQALADSGVRRINVSLDSLDTERFAYISRRGRLEQVLGGLAAAKTAGLAVKINMVLLAGLNEDDLLPMMRWCADQGFALTLIETMPLGTIDDDRVDRYLSLNRMRESLETRFTLIPTLDKTGGPARYTDVKELGLRLGFITPLSDNFCAGCNRIRVTATGTIYGCLGHDQKVELRDLLRAGGADQVNATLDKLLAGKPRRHQFDIAAHDPAVARHMSVTGG